jgi:hypothetical protein
MSFTFSWIPPSSGLSLPPSILEDSKAAAIASAMRVAEKALSAI